MEDMKLVATSISEPTKTSKGATMWKLNLKPADSPFTLNATTFNETVANAIKERIGVEATYKVKTGEYNGQATYTINGVDGIEASGFKKAPGRNNASYQKDVISIERQQSAKVATDMMAYATVDQLKDPVKHWIKNADKIYAWISARPATPPATVETIEE